MALHFLFKWLYVYVYSDRANSSCCAPAVVCILGTIDVEAPPDPPPPPPPLSQCQSSEYGSGPDQPLLRSRSPSTSYTEPPASPGCDMRCPLHLPGRILQLTSTETPNRSAASADVCSSRQQFSVAWSSADNFDRIKLSNSMLNDHLPNVVAAAVKSAAHDSGSGAGSHDALPF